MKFKYIFSTVGLISLLFPALSSAYENISDYDDLEGWIEVFPARYDTVEQFFLQQGCRFAQNAVFIYNLDDEHWLSGSQARAALPAIDSHFVDRECDISVSKINLKDLLNIESFDQQGSVLLYFDIARDEDADPRIILTESMLSNYYTSS